MKKIFEKELVAKITLLQIPSKRQYMHIDTIFTHVDKGVWVLLAGIESEYDKKGQLLIQQYHIGHQGPVRAFDKLQDMLKDVSITDFGCQPEDITFILSGDGVYPYNVREQWTDSCNVLALKEGVVIGYDRNDRTLKAFEKAGFSIVKVADLLYDLENELINTKDIQRTFISMPSAELSRARGGFHCMSMPLLRD